MAAVGAVYTTKPFARTADDVIDEVMRKEARQRRPSPQNKRVRAELLVGKVALFLWLAAGGDPPQSPRDQTGDFPLGWRTGVA